MPNNTHQHNANTTVVPSTEATATVDSISMPTTSKTALLPPWWSDSMRKVGSEMVAGAGAGAMAAFATCPLDVIRTRLQVQSGGNVRYSGTIGSFKTIMREEGIHGLYRGMETTLLALVPNWAMYFTMYSHFKNEFSKYGIFRENTSLMYMCSALTAGSITDVVCTPFWTIKTRIQTQEMWLDAQRRTPATATTAAATSANVVLYRGTFDAARTMIRQEGFLSLYKGLTPQLFGNGLTVAIQFPLYEKIKSELVSRGFATSAETLSPLQLITASIVAKTIAGLIAYPHQIVRARLQYQRSYRNSSSNAASASSATNTVTTTAATAATTEKQGIARMISSIWKQEGIAGFYRGLAATLIRVTPATAVTFFSYEMFLRYLKSSSSSS